MMRFMGIAALGVALLQSGVLGWLRDVKNAIEVGTAALGDRGGPQLHFAQLASSTVASRTPDATIYMMDGGQPGVTYFTTPGGRLVQVVR